MADSIMATKMNSNTHKVMVARYEGPDILYAVPKDWDLEKVLIKWGVFYYDGEEVNPPKVETEPDGKFPIEVEDGSNDYHLDQWFDCEEEEEELLEGLCPFGDKCDGETDEESDSD
jgi:hypothetical protein